MKCCTRILDDELHKPEYEPLYIGQAFACHFLYAQGCPLSHLLAAGK